MERMRVGHSLSPFLAYATQFFSFFFVSRSNYFRIDSVSLNLPLSASLRSNSFNVSSCYDYSCPYFYSKELCFFSNYS
jgi:hypothetical protein